MSKQLYNAAITAFFFAFFPITNSYSIDFDAVVNAKKKQTTVETTMKDTAKLKRDANSIFNHFVDVDSQERSRSSTAQAQGMEVVVSSCNLVCTKHLGGSKNLGMTTIRSLRFKIHDVLDSICKQFGKGWHKDTCCSNNGSCL